jgi:hypothetical protein
MVECVSGVKAGARSRTPKQPADQQTAHLHMKQSLTPSSAAEAPLDWAYALFPLPAEGEESLSIEWLVRLAHERIDRAGEMGDEAHFGPVLHWAHILKSEQGPDGDWPAHLNARTGAAIGAARTRTPAQLLARLDALLDSSEFEAAVARARVEGDA